MRGSIAATKSILCAVMGVFDILIADDHPTFRRGLANFLESQSTCRVVGEAATGLAAIQQVESLTPELLILDIGLPDISGIDVAETILSRRIPTRILVLSGYSEPEYVLRVVQIGVHGFIAKEEPLSEIWNAIESVICGREYLSPQLALEIARTKQALILHRQAEYDTCCLLRDLGITPRLLHILKMTAHGMNNEAIAKKVFRSEHTVRNQIEKIKSLVGVKWRPALIAWAWENNVIVVDEPMYERLYNRNEYPTEESAYWDLPEPDLR